MTDSTWGSMGLDEGGLPIHLPMAVTHKGEGPADGPDAAKMVCWCRDRKCPVTRALREAHELGRKTSRDELTESYIKELEEQRDILLQAIWDARTVLGFDTDGDKQFHIQKDRRNIEMVAKAHVDEATEARAMQDEADAEYEDLERRIANQRKSLIYYTDLLTEASAKYPELGDALTQQLAREVEDE